MSRQVDSPTPAYDRRWRLLDGVVAISIGVAVLVWPTATVRVVGLLFGLHLLVTGTVRAVVLAFRPQYPVLHRVLGATFGVITALIGIFCLFNAVGSVTLLALVVGVSWLLGGLIELIAGLRGSDQPDRAGQIAAGLAHVLAAIAVLAWPKAGLATFLAVGALSLIVVGVAELVGAMVTMRQPHGHRDPKPDGWADG